jgi:acyl-CoA synthetase (NDP forming)
MDSLTSLKTHILDYAFFPQSVAVVGASDQPFSFGYHFLRHLLDHKYRGAIYPVNPQKETLLGVKCYPNLAAVPGDVEFVICCVPTNRVLALLDDCAGKKVKVVHLFTARLGETGRPDAIELEKQILLKARQHGIRLIGPNCMGVYSPAAGIAFGYDLPSRAGDIGLVFQSGGAATVLIQCCALLGLNFSKAVSYGNALDLDESDIIDYFIQDDQTTVIATYFEGIHNGAKFIDTLKRAAAKKPVIAIKGGRGKSGSRAVASHTAAIAGTQDLWQTAFHQTGVIEVNDFDEMANLLQLFHTLPPIYNGRAAIMGGGGGKAVIAADLAEEVGLSVPPLTEGIRAKLKDIVPDLWDWLGNPVDTSIWGDSGPLLSEVPKLFAESPDYDFIIIQSSEDNPMADDLWMYIIRWGVEITIDAFKKGGKPVIAVLSGGKPGQDGMQNIRWKTMAEQRSKLVSEGVPVFDTMAEAVKALSKYTGYWRNKKG